MEIEQLPELLQGMETNSKGFIIIIIILNIQMNDPINFKPLCSVTLPSNPGAVATGPAAVPWVLQAPLLTLGSLLSPWVVILGKDQGKEQVAHERASPQPTQSRQSASECCCV